MQEILENKNSLLFPKYTFKMCQCYNAFSPHKYNVYSTICLPWHACLDVHKLTALCIWLVALCHYICIVCTLTTKLKVELTRNQSHRQFNTPSCFSSFSGVCWLILTHRLHQLSFTVPIHFSIDYYLVLVFFGHDGFLSSRNDISGVTSLLWQLNGNTIVSH